jgi:ubiquinone/menaquinone biosynthesis C-methylase UbiE
MPATSSPTSASSAETERVKHIWDRAARWYDRQMALWERLLFAGGRQWVCAQAHGDTLEVGIGTGRNLGHYPPGVHLIGVDLSEAMLAIARQRAVELGRDVELHVGDAQALGFPAASFDTVVVTLSLCSIPDDRRAVAEINRVLRPGGRLLLLEHVRSPHRRTAAVQRLLERFTIRWEGDHLAREPLELLEAEGLEIERVERSKHGIVERVRARKPDPTTTDGEGG